MSNIDTVQTIYAAFGRGDVPTILAALTDDVQWEEGQDYSPAPWITPGQGKAHVGRFFETVGRSLEFSDFAVESLLVGEGQVAAVVRVKATVRETGKTFADREIHLWSFDDAGRVRGFRHYADTLKHHQAAAG